jgi:uncharacterized damage-inducible protein DinB
MKDFILDKFEYDFYASKSLIEHIERQEDKVSSFVIKSISHIINVHHIWNSRLFGKKAESGVWDILPVPFLLSLHRQNYRETIDYLEKIELGEKVNYHSSEGVQFDQLDLDILYHMLTHSNYHRAQIIHDMKQNQLEVPSMNFISFKD